MRRANPVLRAGAARGIVERVQLHTHEDVHASAVLVLELAYCCHISIPVHMDVLIHVTREAKGEKPLVKARLGHLLRRVLAVAERRVRVEVCSYHPGPSVPPKSLPHTR